MNRTGSTLSLQGALETVVAGERAVCLRSGGLWLPRVRTLVVADLHFEKGSSYAAAGQMLPPYDSHATLGRLAEETERLAPAAVIALGDSFHDRRARSRMDVAVVEGLRALSVGLDWIWICGNHDPAPPADLGGRVLQEHAIGPLVFRHEPLAGPTIGEIAGHLHPCARVSSGERSVRSKCFVSNGQRLVLPSFGALTGGLNVCDEAFAPLFSTSYAVGVIGRDGVYAVRTDRLTPDRVRTSRLAG